MSVEGQAGPGAGRLGSLRKEIADLGQGTEDAQMEERAIMPLKA